MEIAQRVVSYTADRLEMISQLFGDDSHGGMRPGVLLFPEAFGLGDQ
ncbi:hypothetical protein [Sphingobium sp. Sx8-8]|nr:hypothetical protein [Sphingobium sp. Sx8-8]